MITEEELALMLHDAGMAFVPPSARKGWDEVCEFVRVGRRLEARYVLARCEVRVKGEILVRSDARPGIAGT